MLNTTRRDESGSMYKDTSVACFQCSGTNMNIQSQKIWF